MANRRNLKKDIDYLAYEVISDCFTFMQLHDNKDEEVRGIISNTIGIRNDLITRVNHVDGKDNTKLVKAHFKKIKIDLLNGIDQQFTELSKLSEK